MLQETPKSKKHDRVESGQNLADEVKSGTDYCYDPTLVTKPKTSHIQKISSLYAFAFSASFSRRTKRPAGASIPRLI